MLEGFFFFSQFKHRYLREYFKLTEVHRTSDFQQLSDLWFHGWRTTEIQMCISGLKATIFLLECSPSDVMFAEFRSHLHTGVSDGFYFFFWCMKQNHAVISDWEQWWSAIGLFLISNIKHHFLVMCLCMWRNVKIETGAFSASRIFSGVTPCPLL